MEQRCSPRKGKPVRTEASTFTRHLPGQEYQTAVQQCIFAPMANSEFIINRVFFPQGGKQRALKLSLKGQLYQKASVGEIEAQGHSQNHLRFWRKAVKVLCGRTDQPMDQKETRERHS